MSNSRSSGMINRRKAWSRRDDLPWIISIPPKVRFFTGRSDLLQQIHQQLHCSQENQAMAVIVGIGGVGKSCLALQYAHDHADNYNIVAWLNAENEISLQNDFIKLGQRITDAVTMALEKVPITLNTLKSLIEQYQKTPAIRHDLTSDTLKRQPADTQLLERIIEVTHDVLDQKLCGPWLLIYDNIHQVKMVNKYFSPMQNGHMILTSRHRSWDDVIEVDVFDRQTSIEFLQRVTGYHSNDDDSNVVADLLGDLPLALSQAAQYIKRKKITIAAYANEFKSFYQKLWQREAPSSSYKQYLSEDKHQCVVAEHTLETTWQLAVSQIASINPIASDLSTIAAYMSPSNIGSKLLVTLGVEFLNATEHEVEAALEVLYDYSLIGRNNDSYSIHRLLQLVIRNKYKDTGVDKVVLNKFLKYYNQHINYDRRDISATLNNVTLIEHFDILKNYVQNSQSHVDQEIVTAILLSIGRIYCALSYFSTAKEYLNEVIDKLSPLVDNSISTGDISQSQLAQLSRALRLNGRVELELNNYDTSLAYLERALELDKQTDHTASQCDIGSTLQLIGQVNCRKGKFTTSDQFLQQALKIQLKCAGEDHLDTSETYLWLGRVASKTGKLDMALEYANKALKIDEKELGKNSLDVAMIYETIGHIFRENYNYKDALENFQHANRFYKIHIGEDGIKVADSLQAIARIYRQLRDFDKALVCSQDVLAIKRKQLGQYHLSLAYTHDEIGVTYIAKKNYTNALDNLQHALQIKQMHLGEQHINISYTLDKIGLVYKAKKCFDDAMNYFEKSLQMKQKNLGNEHDSVAYTYHQIGVIYKEKNDFSNSLKYLQLALRIKSGSFGAEHVQASYTLHEIGLLYDRKNDQEEALKYLLKAYAIKSKQLGQDHVRTIDTLSEIDAIRFRIKNIKITEV